MRGSREIGQRAEGKLRVVLNGGYRPFRRTFQHFDDRRDFFLLCMIACYLERSVGHKFLSAPVLCVGPLAQNSTTRSVTSLATMRQVDRKSTRLNSSHGYISYAVFCLK